MERTERFGLTADDLVNAGRLYAWHGFRRPRVVIAWLGLWLAFLIFLGFVASSGTNTPGKWLGLLGISLLPFILVLGLTFWLTPMAARRTFRQQKSLHGDLAYGWSDAGLHIDGQYGQFDMPWSHFIRWVEDDRSFLLFESDRLYRVVPKRVLTPDQQASLSRQLAKVGR